MSNNVETSDKGGKRFEIIVLKINRNDEGVINQLFKLEALMKTRGESYSVLHASYGSPAKALKKTIAWYLDTTQLAHPMKTLYEVNKMFIDRKLVRSADVGDMGLQADVEKLYNIVAGYFGKAFKKPEDVEEDEDSTKIIKSD